MWLEYVKKYVIKKCQDNILSKNLVLMWYECVTLKVERAFAAKLALPMLHLWTCAATMQHGGWVTSHVISKSYGFWMTSWDIAKVLTLGSPVVLSCLRVVRPVDANLDSSSHCCQQLGSSLCLGRLLRSSWTIEHLFSNFICQTKPGAKSLLLPDLCTILWLDRRCSLPAHLVRLRVHGEILETSVM